MAIYVRDKNRVTFKFESGTYAVASGTSGNWLGLVTKHDPKENENMIEIRYAGTGNRNYGQLLNGPRDYEGTITYHPQEFRMFAFALGSCVDGGSPSPYTHVISELNSDGLYAYTSGTANLTKFPSFTVVDSKQQTSDGDHLVRVYTGAVVDSISMKATEGEPIECELSYKAQALTVGSKSTDVVNILDEDTSRPYLWSDVKVHLPSGTTIVPTKEVEFRIENNLETRHYANGSVVAQAQIPTMRNYELNLTLDANNTWGTTLENYHINGTSFNAMLEATISAGSEDVFIIMSGCKVYEFAAPSESEGVDEFTMTIKPQTTLINVNDLMFKYNPW